jgi:tetratricopeptide (TPR) repeat protein
MLVTAARLAVARFDQREALRLLDEAVSLHDTVGARLERARVCSMLARYDQASEDIEVALSWGAGAEALEVAAWSAHLQRRFDQALTLADQGAQQATDVDLRTSCLALGGWVSLVSGDLGGAAHRLEGAAGAAPVASGRMVEAWLAWLRVNQGRPAETLRLVKQHDGEGLAAYRFPNAYALMAATMALGMLGRAEEALATLDALDADVARMGAALAHALLDLASGRLLTDDLHAAGKLLDEATALAEVEHAFRWRHQLRSRLVRARLDLALGDAEAALTGAESLAVDAAALGAPRYHAQARLVAATAAHRAGGVVDLDEVGRLLLRLDEVAGLEAWWITGEVAAAFGVGAWEDLARRRVGKLRTRAGSYTGALERETTRRLGWR